VARAAGPAALPPAYTEVAQYRRGLIAGQRPHRDVSPCLLTRGEAAHQTEANPRMPYVNLTVHPSASSDWLVEVCVV
jgi:hypothetical protein